MLADALAAAAQGRFTTDAALATLDFAVRFGVLAGDDPAAIALRALVVGIAGQAPSSNTP